MTCRNALLTGLISTMVLLSPALLNAQPVLDPTDGVRLRETSDLGLLDHLSILARRAFVPGARVVAPLHSYPGRNACDPDQSAALIGHSGSAALVATVGETTFGIYFRTVPQALRAARQYGWCQTPEAAEQAEQIVIEGPNGEEITATVWRPDPSEWDFATTFPVPEWTARDHFVSLDIDRVEASIATTDAWDLYETAAQLPRN